MLNVKRNYNILINIDFEDFLLLNIKYIIINASFSLV